MGETISTLVFRPPPTTYMCPSKYFFLDVEVPAAEVGLDSILGCSMAGNSDSSSLMCTSTSSGLGTTMTTNSQDTSQCSHRISAFFIKRKKAKVTLLFSHGNAEDLGMMYIKMKEISRVVGVNVMAYDYTGYGYSSGSTPSEEMTYKNIDAAFKYLTNEQGIPPSQIVVYGRSLGSGPSCYLAAKTAREGKSVAGLILHSPFLSIFRIVMDCGFSISGDMFKNIAHAPDIRCPVLIIHGTKDDIVPFWHGQELLRTLPEHCRAQPFWAEEMGHNNIEIFLKREYIQRIINFVNRYVPAHKMKPKGDMTAQTNKLVPSDPSQPVRVPEGERAREESMNSSSSRFIINSMWVRNGAGIVNHALNITNTKRPSFRKESHGMTPDREEFEEDDEREPSDNVDKETEERHQLASEDILAEGGEQKPGQESADKNTAENEIHEGKQLPTTSIVNELIDEQIRAKAEREKRTRMSHLAAMHLAAMRRNKDTMIGERSRSDSDGSKARSDETHVAHRAAMRRDDYMTVERHRTESDSVEARSEESCSRVTDPRPPRETSEQRSDMANEKQRSNSDDNDSKQADSASDESQSDKKSMPINTAKHHRVTIGRRAAVIQQRRRSNSLGRGRRQHESHCDESRSDENSAEKNMASGSQTGFNRVTCNPRGNEFIVNDDLSQNPRETPPPSPLMRRGPNRAANGILHNASSATDTEADAEAEIGRTDNKNPLKTTDNNMSNVSDGQISVAANRHPPKPEADVRNNEQRNRLTERKSRSRSLSLSRGRRSEPVISPTHSEHSVSRSPRKAMGRIRSLSASRRRPYSALVIDPAHS